MAFFNEFPYTRNYDTDLGWLIRNVKKLMQKFERCPTWYGDWVAEIEYPALAFVQYGANGDTYMSIKDVPANTPITDTNYWVKTGSTAEQILELQRRMADAETDIDTLQDDAELFRNAIYNLRVNSAQTGKWIFVGESWANPEYADWIPKLAQFIGIESTDYYDCHVSGGSFMANSFFNSVSSLISTLTDDEKKDIARVVVLSGINDAGQGTKLQIMEKISDFCTLCNEYFPNCKIYIGMIGNSVESSPILMNRTKFSLTNDVLPAYQACGRYGAAYITNSEFIMHDYSLFASDGIHPTAAGGDEIARFISSALLGGGVDVCRIDERQTDEEIAAFLDTTTATYAKTTIAGTNFQNSKRITIMQHNALTKINLLGRISIIPDTAITISPITTQIRLGKFVTPLWDGTQYTLIPVSINMRKADGSGFHRGEGILFMLSGASGVILRIDTIDGNWYGSSVQVTQIVIEGINYATETMIC